MTPGPATDLSAEPAPSREAEFDAGGHQHLRPGVLGLGQLAAMSVSSVGPVFSIAAAVGPMIAAGGYGAPVGMWLAFLPFLASALTFRHLNRHLPNAGASYGWTLKALGPVGALAQAWMVILAYFFSLLAIIVPAGTYTLALLAPSQVDNNLAVSLVGSGWAIFAAIPLIAGIGPTVKLTTYFLVTEAIVIGAFFALGFVRLATRGAVVHPTASWFVPNGHTHFGQLLIAAVVGFTIVDGWELDSHAAEEAKNKRINPGTGGLIGLLSVTGLYVVGFFLLFSLAPLPGLIAHQTNVLSYFSGLIAPAWATKIMIVGILASTASGLWLTHYILNRALFAMSRDGVIPARLGKIHPKFATPARLVLITTIAEVAVTTLLVNIPNVASFFAVILQSAGFFLAAVFVLSNISALVYFRRVARGSVKHFLLLGVLPAVATASMLTLMIGYTRQQNGTTLAVIGGLLVLTLAFIGQARLRRASALTSVRESAAAYDHPYQHRSLHHEHDALHPAHPEAPDTPTRSTGAA